jgi:integrase
MKSGSLTLADVEQEIADDATLSASRKAGLRSAIKRLAVAFNLPLEIIPANVDFIRVKLSRVTPAEVGMTAKRLSTVKSEVKFALRHVGIIDKGTYLHPMAGPWLGLWEALPSKYSRTVLSRFFRYCSRMGVAPGDVTDPFLEDFRKALETETFVKDPRVLHQNTARVWNQMRGVVLGWPDIELTVPHLADHYTLGWSAFPDSLKADVDAFTTRQGSDDLLDFDAPPRPLKPVTLKKYAYELRRAASILVLCDHEANGIDSIAYLVEVEHVEQVLRFMLARKGEQKSHNASDMADLLAKVAQHYVKAPAEDVVKIKSFRAKLRPTPGLSRKNRQRLAPLRDPLNLAKLFMLPDKIRKSVETKATPTRADALLMQHAVALSILTHAPIRIGNLAALDCTKQLHWTQADMGGELLVDIDAEVVKNEQTLSFPLPRSCAALVRLYLRTYRPLLMTANNTFLFPGPHADRSKRSDTLGKQLTRLVHKSVGLRVNPHLYRHLVHIVVLNRFPGAYAMVSRVLGHKSLQTAISNYAGEDINISMRAFQGLIQELQRGAGRRPADAAAVAYGFQERSY